MTETIEAEVVVVTCSGCGDAVATVDETTKCGPCCHNLPQRWCRSSDGLYNSTDDEDAEVDEEGEEEDEDAPPRCRGCGSRDFRVTGEQVVTTTEGDGESVYYDFSDFELELRCADCGDRPRHLSLEHS